MVCHKGLFFFARIQLILMNSQIKNTVVHMKGTKLMWKITVQCKGELIINFLNHHLFIIFNSL